MNRFPPFAPHHYPFYDRRPQHAVPRPRTIPLDEDEVIFRARRWAATPRDRRV